MKKDIPVLAILGHPNEGKSSVVSTLAEDDSIPISPVPGETIKCREYPVSIDMNEIIRFVDTPGFQQPRKTLAWITAYAGAEKDILTDFIRSHQNDPEFADECELFSPLADGAGIIFVVDGSRPVRKTDIIEMEILRKTGLPRMIVINPKTENDQRFMDEWKSAARRHFNTIRIFNANRACFAERIDLLSSLKGIDPDWQPALERVIDAFTADWKERISQTAAIIADVMRKSLTLTMKKTCRDPQQASETRAALMTEFEKKIARIEQDAHHRIKKRFKHNIFSYDLPPQSILTEDLFAKKTWKVLGVSRRELAIAGAGIGAGIGAKIDLATAGLTFGLFTAIGGALGAGSAAAGTRKLARSRIKGLPLGGVSIRIGPVENDQLLYVIIDRALIYFHHVINWAHSRRDKPETGRLDATGIDRCLTGQWPDTQKRTAKTFFKTVRKGSPADAEHAASAFADMLRDVLTDLSNARSG